jgi:hypothetical protein
VTVYVDALEDWGWVLRGRRVQSCHMFTDTVELDELHRIALAIGMRLSWFQDKKTAPHYDLTPSRRAAAIAAGAVEVDRHGAVAIWRERRRFLAGLAEVQR